MSNLYVTIESKINKRQQPYPICEPVKCQYQEKIVLARRDPNTENVDMYEIKCTNIEEEWTSPKLVFYYKKTRNSDYVLISPTLDIILSGSTFSCSFSIGNTIIIEGKSETIKKSAIFEFCIEDKNGLRISLGQVRFIQQSSFRRGSKQRKYFSEYRLFPTLINSKRIALDDTNKRPTKRVKNHASQQVDIEQIIPEAHHYSPPITQTSYNTPIFDHRPTAQVQFDMYFDQMITEFDKDLTSDTLETSDPHINPVSEEKHSYSPGMEVCSCSVIDICSTCVAKWLCLEEFSG
eukprot:TRINITY_DN17066_c0_g1_i1.p1 TRINITY_DN17066_c0_g1~~TRINITY_DN17066_c0_g1_i1.p1  ORF type:complete len:304 (+),score=27.89 TRINITY_DN17066_c0_g1_i1:37-912(+)